MLQTASQLEEEEDKNHWPLIYYAYTMHILQHDSYANVRGC